MRWMGVTRVDHIVLVLWRTHRSASLIIGFQDAQISSFALGHQGRQVAFRITNKVQEEQKGWLVPRSICIHTRIEVQHDPAFRYWGFNNRYYMIPTRLRRVVAI